MAYRLLIHIGDRVSRHRLEEGEHTIGSSADCDIPVRHPTVSRQHAFLFVSGEVVTISDLGSSNGTRVDGQVVEAAAAVSPGVPIFLGNVKALLEEVDAGDLEAGISLQPADAARDDGSPESGTAASTVGPAVLEVFSLVQLPGLVGRVARGESTTDVAQAVGAALLGSLPCSRVEVVGRGGSRAGVLFTGERRNRGDRVTIAAQAGDGYQIEVDFLSASLAETYGPLVVAASALVRASGRSVLGGSARTPPEPVPPRPPDPPTVVASVREIYAQATRVAGGRVSVLIRGESGTGKELLARYIHTASDRAEAPLVTLNCAALPRDLLESELFGVERGVATGVEARAGRFEAAHGGTLFLDEIGDMAPETQARILRVLAEGEVYRLGSHTAKPADVRVISATNREIDAMLEEGSFRRDLYHRIADWVVEIPPLRDRRADIPNLAAHFLAHACEERGVRAAGISRSALDALVNYEWPGNVRQLEKEMGRAALFLEDGELLDTARLQPMITESLGEVPSGALKEVLESAERQHIRRVLEESNGEVARAAERLEIGLSTIYRRMKAMGID